MKPRLSKMLKSAVGFFSTRTAIISSYCGWEILPNKISSINTFIDLRKLCKMVDAKLDAVQLVDIEEGIFKYVLIKVYGKEKSDGTEPSKKIVRGYTDCQWHSDIYERVSTSCKGLGLETECLGGGRIEHNPSAKFIKVYGYSQGFGKADHAESRDILRSKYHDYEIQISDDGY